MSHISCRNISIKYGKNTVIDKMNLEIEDGSFFTLLGPSGCGKTTLLRAIAGFINPSAGSIYFDRDNITNVPAHKRNIGFVFQGHALFPNLNVFDNIAYGLRARKVREREISGMVSEAVEMVGLKGFSDRFPSEMSGGQQQRVALARALVIRPSVLLMDEPLSSLDTKLRCQMRNVIADIQKEIGITTVFVTHDQEEALDLATNIAVLKDGAIEQVGSPYKIYTEPETAFVADFIGSANLIKVDDVRGIKPGLATCKLNNGKYIKASIDADSKLNGSGAFLVARPEELSIRNENTESGNCIKGTLVRTQYLGYKTTSTVRVHNELDIIVDEINSDIIHKSENGTDVYVHIPETSRLVRG